MKRDFTPTCYSEFCKLLDELKDDGWTGIRDWFGDLYESFRHFLALQGYLSQSEKMEAYYKDLLERQKASKNFLKQVFEDISALDVSFGGDTPGHFGYCKKQLEAFSQYITALSSNASSGACPAAAGGFFSSYFATARINAIMEKPLHQLQVHTLPVFDFQFTASTFYRITNGTKEAFVSRCETARPELAKKLDRVFSDSDWDDQQKTDIKFLIYSAPEPYRSLYLQHVDRHKAVVFQDVDYQTNISSSRYIDVYETIYLEDGMDVSRDNDRGPYNVFFHESGHAIDDYAPTYGWHSGVYELYGQKLHDSMVHDARTYVSNLINNSKKYKDLDDWQKGLLLTSLNLSDNAYFQYEGHVGELTEELKDYRRQIQIDMRSDMCTDADIAASDVYGGITNNAIVGLSAHYDEWYWYIEGNTPTNNQASELWAEFFASQMTHDVEALASIEKHFPTAYPLLEELARDLFPK